MRTTECDEGEIITRRLRRKEGASPVSRPWLVPRPLNQHPAQVERIGVAGVGDPGPDLGIGLSSRHCPGPPAVAQAPQPVAEAGHVVLRQPPAAGQQYEAEELSQFCCRQDSTRLRRDILDWVHVSIGVFKK